MQLVWSTLTTETMSLYADLQESSGLNTDATTIDTVRMVAIKTGDIVKIDSTYRSQNLLQAKQIVLSSFYNTHSLALRSDSVLSAAEHGII